VQTAEATCVDIAHYIVHCILHVAAAAYKALEPACLGFGLLIPNGVPVSVPVFGYAIQNG
jgi:hypothetical protein